MYKYRRSTIATLGSLFLAALILAGCAGSPEKNPRYAPLAEIKSSAQSVNIKSYRIGPGDDIEVKFLAAKELNERQIVAPDGNISLMFAPSIHAAGMTVEGLTSFIADQLGPHVNSADISVVVRRFTSSRIYVEGEVLTPGAVRLDGPTTVLQALTLAGGMTPLAGRDKILLVRRTPGDTQMEEKIYPINIEKLSSGTDMSQNVLVEPGDVLLVPPSDVVTANRWVDQHIRQMLPLPSSASVSYSRGGNN
jgi:polysaccharide biosynthesis/export protein